MSRNVLPAISTVEPLYLRPWVVLLVGLGSAVVGLGLCNFDGSGFVVARLAFLVVGLILAGAAVERRFRIAGQELEERMETAGMLALAAFVAIVAFLATDKDWSSAHLFLGGAVGVALLGAVLVMAPSVVRRAMAGVLILFHFVGIFVAATNIAPPGGQAPWVTEQAWSHVYRYYLSFFYLTNAYHFYSPDPGPSTLLWFRVQYEDDKYRWVKLPDKSASPVPLHYTRTMVVADSTNLPGPTIPPALFEKRINERREAGRFFRPDPTRDGEKFEGQPIPIMLEDLTNPFNRSPLPPDAYREPNDYSKLLISSFVRHVAVSYPHPSDPSIPVKNVKVYRIVHKLIGAGEMAVGRDPMQEVYFAPYFMGKFDTNGELIVKQQQYDQNMNPLLKEYDGFLYWTIPILAVPKGPPRSDFVMPFESKDFDVRNYLDLHAGDIRSFDDKKAEPMKEEGRK